MRGFDVLTLEPAQVYVTGVTLYHDGGHMLADAQQTLHRLKNRDGTWACSLSGDGHDSYLERDIMRWLARAFRTTVRVDGDLLKILGYTTAPNPWPAESHTSSASNTTERS